MNTNDVLANCICANCLTKFYRRESRNKSKSGLYFCSMSCRAAAQASGLLPSTARKETKNYYRGTCAGCQEPMRSSSPLKNNSTHLACRVTYLRKTWLAGDNDIALVYNKETGKPHDTKQFVKDYLLEIRGDKCERCGFNEHGPFGSIIQLDHINGNRFDNNINNLRLLCPNCHCMTETWGSYNKAYSRLNKDTAL